jgi:hypothetical protein
MDLQGEGAGVYSEAKSEYTRQLCQFLVPALQKYYLDMVEAAKQAEPEPKKVLLKFQHMLEDISEWNIDKVQRETQTLAMSTQCDYLEELLTAVFIAHTKVLSAIRLTHSKKKLQITIPKLDHFLHRTLVECARHLWNNTYLFSPNAPSIERQKNQRQIETLLMEGVLQGIRGMLPVKNILREYLREDVSDEEEEGEEEGEGEAEAEAPEAKEEVKQESETPAPPQQEEVAPPAQPILSLTEVVSLAPPAVEESIPEPVVLKVDTPLTDISGLAVIPIAAPPMPSMPTFTGSDAPEQTTAEVEEFLDEEIQMVDAPPEPMDGFEDLEHPEPEAMPMEFDEVLPA